MPAGVSVPGCCSGGLAVRTTSCSFCPSCCSGWTRAELFVADVGELTCPPEPGTTPAVVAVVQAEGLVKQLICWPGVSVGAGNTTAQPAVVGWARQVASAGNTAEQPGVRGD